MTLDEALRTLGKLLETALPRLQSVEESRAAVRPAMGGWSRKEILGHLIDSASNNHQRFVRAQAEQQLSLPGYQQEFWVARQDYQNESWNGLVALWQAYNRHLLHVVSAVPADGLKHQLSIGGAAPVTLEFVITDYVRHMEHHLRQILE